MFKKTKQLLYVVLVVSLISCITLPTLASSESEKVTVEATGSAPLTADRGVSKANALKDAFRVAIEQALGVRITATTVIEDLTVTNDVVISQSWGHILSYSVIKEWEAHGNLFVTITAEVSSDTRWWAEYEGILDVVRLHVKDLVLKKTIGAPGEILPGAVYYNQSVIIPYKTDQYRVTAIHTESHQIMWKRDLPSKPTLPLYSDGNWVVAVTSDKIIVLNPQYGWVKWTYKLDDSVYQLPVIDGETMYVTTKKGNFLAIGMQKGSLLWKYSSQSFFPSAPAVAGGYAYFMDAQGYLHTLDLARQSRAYKQMVNQNVKTKPTATPIYTYLSWCDTTDRIVALNSLDGSTVWSFTGSPLPSATSALPPYLANGRILAVFPEKNESRLYLLDAKSGRLLWEKKLELTVTEVVGMGNGVIILNTWEGPRILDLEFGKILWETAGSGLKAQLISGEDRLIYLHNLEIDIFR